MLGAATAYAGRPDEALEHVEIALRLSPRDTFLDKFFLYKSLAHFQAARYADAAEAVEKAVQLKPDHPGSQMLATASYALAGNQKAAEAALEAFKKLVPGTTASNVERAIAYNDPDDRARLAEGLRKAGLAD